jgi:anti-anti-sigma factor
VSESVSGWLRGAGDGLADELARKLSAKPGSVFRAIGGQATRAIVGRMLAALASDAPGGADEAGRAAVQELVGELAPRGLVFADLRVLTGSLRAALLAAEVEADGRARIEAWLFTIVTAAATQFLAHREKAFHEQATRLEVRQLESQLGELKAAYEEKSRLLELIRQASTPIAPIHDGILVVPVVGVLDGFRAEVLTDKLLNAVTRARAQVVLVDVSGVPVFDAEAAQHVLRAAQAVRLLGSRVVLVGLSPEMAGTIVDLGLDLAGVRTLGSLQDGLALALSLRKLRIAPIAERK